MYEMCQVPFILPYSYAYTHTVNNEHTFNGTCFVRLYSQQCMYAGMYASVCLYIQCLSYMLRMCVH